MSSILPLAVDGDNNNLTFSTSTPAYLSFSVREPRLESGPVIPADLLPSPPVDLKQICEQAAQAPNKSPQPLCDAILRGDTVQQLIPKIGKDLLLSVVM